MPVPSFVASARANANAAKPEPKETPGRHPAEYLVTYLLVTMDDTSTSALNHTLRGFGLAPISAEQISQIRARLPAIPNQFVPEVSTRQNDAFLRKARIYSLVRNDEGIRPVQDAILSNPLLRERIELLLLGRVSVKEISYRLRTVGRISIPEGALELFRHYFWNTEIMSVSDWSLYFMTDEQNNGRSLARTSVLNSVLIAGSEVALHRAGFARQLDSKKLLEEVQRSLYSTFKEIDALPLSPAKVGMLCATVTSLARIDERVQAGDNALQETLARFDKFRVQFSENTIPTIGALAPRGTMSRSPNREEKR